MGKASWPQETSKIKAFKKNFFNYFLRHILILLLFKSNILPFCQHYSGLTSKILTLEAEATKKFHVVDVNYVCEKLGERMQLPMIMVETHHGDIKKRMTILEERLKSFFVEYCMAMKSG